MTNFELPQSSEVLTQKLKQINKEWLTILKRKFKKDYPAFGSIEKFLEKNNKNPFEKDLMENKISKLIEKIINLEKLSNQDNLSLLSLQNLLTNKNLLFIPLTVKENLQKKLNFKILDSAKDLDNIFLEKKQILKYIKNNNSTFLLSYITFLNSLDDKQRFSLGNALKNNHTKENYKNISYSTIKGLSSFSPLINQDHNNLFPLEFKQNLNKTISELIQKGHLNSLNIYTYAINEDGILGINKKVGKIGTGYNENSKKLEVTTESIKSDSLKGYSDILNYYSGNLEALRLLILKKVISKEDLNVFGNIKKELNRLTKDIQKKNNFIPWEVIEIQNKIEKIDTFLKVKNPEQNEKLEHSQKMSRFLNSAITWLDSEDNGGWTETDINTDRNKVLKLVEKINKLQITSFTQINDSKVEDFLGSFYEELYEGMETKLGDNGVISKDLEGKGLGDSYIQDVSMQTLDEFVDNFGNGGDWSFSKIETVTAQLIIDNNTNNKMPAFNLMIPNILDKHKINPSENSIKEKSNEILKNVNINQHISELVNLSRIEQEKILIGNGLKKEVVDTLNKIEIRNNVLEIIKEKSAEKGAEMMLYLQEAQTLYEAGKLDGDNSLFFKEYGDWKNKTAEVTSMIVKEAIIMTVATMLTGGIGTVAAGSLLALNGASKVARVINLARNGISSGTGILAKSVRVGVSGSKLGLDTLAYLAVSDTVYEGDQLTIENFIHTYSMFLGGFVGLKLGNKIIKPTDPSFAKQLKLIAGGAVGGTAAGTGILVFGHSNNITEINTSEVGNMMLQGMLMGGLLMPLMKGGHNIGKWGGNKINKGLDKNLYQGIRNRTSASLTAKTEGKTDFYNQQRDTLIDSLLIFRSNNKIINFGRVSKKIDKLLTENTRLNDLKKYDFKQADIILNIYKNQLNKYRIDLAGKKPGKTSEGLKKAENKVQKLENDILQNRSEIRKLEESLDKYIKDKLSTEDAINNLPEAHPLRRLLKETTTIKDRIPLYIAKKWNNVRLNRIKLIKQSGTAEWLGNGYYLKKGTTITNAAGKELFTLPKGVKIESVEQLNIGNNRITALKIKGGELIRIYKDAESVPQKLMEKVLNSESNVQGVYNKSNSKLEGYTVVEGGKIEYYTISGNKSKKEFSNPDKYFEKTVTSSGRISNAELKLSGIEANKLGKIRRNWDTKFNEVMTESTMTNLKDGWLKTLKNVKNNPKASSEQVAKADSLIKKIALMPVSIIKGIMSKGLWTLAIVGGGALTVDKMSDGEFDLDTLGVGLAAWVLMDDIGGMRGSLLSIAGKVPGLGSIISLSSPIVSKMKNSIPEKFRGIAGLGTILYAMNLYDGSDNK